MLSTTANTAVNNSGVQATAFGMKASAQAFKILSSSLYEDKPKAVLRETTTNALDAHLAAGVTKPIKVVLPTEMEPTLSIEDFGTGMSLEFMQKEYVTYFESTKDKDNELNGGFGLGCKSPLAITDSFTVRSRKGGKEATIVVFVDAGVPNILTVNHTDTKEPDGTKVEIPVSNQNTVRELKCVCRSLFTYWAVKPDFTNGPLLEDFSQPLAKTSSGVYLKTTYSWYTRHYRLESVFNEVVIDCFVYSVPTNVVSKIEVLLEGTDALELLSNPANRISKVLPLIPIGKLELAPSRERIEDTEANVEAIKDYLVACTLSLTTDCEVAHSQFFGILNKHFPGSSGTTTEAFTYEKSLSIHPEVAKINKVELLLSEHICSEDLTIPQKYKHSSLEKLQKLVDPQKHLAGEVGVLATYHRPFVKREARSAGTRFSDSSRQGLYPATENPWFVCNCADLSSAERSKLNKLIRLKHTVIIDGKTLTLGINYLEYFLGDTFLEEVGSTFSNSVVVVKPQDILNLVNKDTFSTTYTTTTGDLIKRKSVKVEDTDPVGTYTVTGKPITLANIDANGGGTPTGNVSKQSLRRFLSDLPKDVYVSFDTARRKEIPEWFEDTIALNQFTCVRIYLKTKATINSKYFHSKLRTQDNVVINLDLDKRRYLKNKVNVYKEAYATLTKEIQVLHRLDCCYSRVVSTSKREIDQTRDPRTVYITLKERRDFLKELPYTSSLLKILSTKAVNQLARFIVLGYNHENTSQSLNILLKRTSHSYCSGHETQQWYLNNFKFIHDRCADSDRTFIPVKRAAIKSLKSFIKEQTECSTPT